MRCIAVYIQDWLPSDQLFDQLVNLLDKESAQRVFAFKHRHDALASLVGRLLPRWEICSYNVRQDWQHIIQAKGQTGRPYLTDASSGQRLDYDFNVSHDSNAIIMVSQLNPGDFRLGVDIMRKGLPTGIPSVLEFAATVDDMLSLSERQALVSATRDQDKLDLLLRSWTIKEAVSKASGQGLGFPFVELDSLQIQRTGGCSVNGKGCHVEVRQHRLSSEVYEIAIASLSGSAAQDSLSVTVEEIPIQRLVSDVLSHARKVSG